MAFKPYKLKDIKGYFMPEAVTPERTAKQLDFLCYVAASWLNVHGLLEHDSDDDDYQDE